MPGNLILGALGGPDTFNGQAAHRILRRYDLFREVTYFSTSEATMAAVVRGEVDAACGQEQTTKDGFHAGMHARLTTPGSSLFVVAETCQNYECSLLAKPGTRLAQITQVIGHKGSVAHSRQWLEKNLPEARIDVVDTNSIGAAKTVIESDGSIASVGARSLARESGLVELAENIADGSAVNYWAVSRKPLFSERPTRLAIVGRLGDKPPLADLVCKLLAIGFVLQAAFPRATGAAIFEYDYLLRFSGEGPLSTVNSELVSFPGFRLAGAWESKE
jgi:chorismate mutase / prephenate dehydratase